VEEEEIGRVTHCYLPSAVQRLFHPSQTCGGLPAKRRILIRKGFGGASLEFWVRCALAFLSFIFAFMVHCRAPDKLKVRRADIMRVLGHVRQREKEVNDREDAALAREREVPAINDELLLLAADASAAAMKATKLAAWQLEAEQAERSERLLADSKKRASSPRLVSYLALSPMLRAHGTVALVYVVWQWTAWRACRAWPRRSASSRRTSYATQCAISSMRKRCAAVVRASLRDP
jgi:hypothetical protein